MIGCDAPDRRYKELRVLLRPFGFLVQPQSNEPLAMAETLITVQLLKDTFDGRDAGAKKAFNAVLANLGWASASQLVGELRERLAGLRGKVAARIGDFENVDLRMYEKLLQAVGWLRESASW